MNRQPSTPPITTKLHPAAIEQARSLLSSIFLGMRTAQTHEFSNRAFDNATRIMFQAASQLYSAIGGFSIQFADASALINGQRVQFDSSAEQSLDSIKRILESGGLSGIEMRNPPTEATMRKLILLFCPKGARTNGRPAVETLATEAEAPNPRTRAIHAYAKLILSRRGEPVGVQRALRELVEIGSERPDLLLELSSRGEERQTAGVALVALVLGAALGLGRDELLQLTSAALMPHVPDGPVGRNAYLRIAVTGEQDEPSIEPASHLFSRIAAVALRYQQLTCGSDSGGDRGTSPIESVARLAGEESARFDPRIVDLLINVLRIFPPGTQVVLDSGENATVIGVGDRWDRPQVRTDDEDREPRVIDLASELTTSVVATRAFVGSALRINLEEVEEVPAIFDETKLTELEVGQMGELETEDREPITEERPAPDIIPIGDLGAIPVEFGPEPLTDADEGTDPATQLDRLEIAETGPIEPLLPAGEPEPLTEDTAISEIDELKERLERRRRREAERTRARRTSRIEHLAEQIAAYRAEREELVDEAASLDKDATAAERLAETVAAKQIDLEVTLKEIHPTMTELAHELDELWAKRQTLGERANELEHRAIAGRADARDAEEKADEADHEAQQRADRIAELEAELEQLRSEFEDLERAADTFRNAAAEEQRIAADAEKAAEALRDEGQVDLPELTAKEERLDAMRDRVHQLEAERLALVQNAENAKAIAEEARDRVNRARARIAEADATLEALEAELEGLESSRLDPFVGCFVVLSAYKRAHRILLHGCPNGLLCLKRERAPRRRRHGRHRAGHRGRRGRRGAPQVDRADRARLEPQAIAETDPHAVEGGDHPGGGVGGHGVDRGRRGDARGGKPAAGRRRGVAPLPVKDGLDVVPVGIDHERTVIVWVVMRPHARRPVVLRPCSDRRLVEGIDVRATPSAEAHVHRRDHLNLLLRLERGRPRADPELRLLSTTVARRRPVLHDQLDPERRQCHLVERL